MGYIETLNREIFLKINAGSDTPHWMIDTAIVIAEGLIYLIPVLLIVQWLWGDERRRNLALKTCMVTLFALGLNHTIGLVWPHPRPFMLGLGQLWLPHAADPSFPSDHATVFTCACISLLFGGEVGLVGLAVVALVIGVCVAWSRIYLGLHFPLDMLGAVVVAAVSYAVIAPLWRKVGSAMTAFAQQLYRSVMTHPIARGWVQP